MHKEIFAIDEAFVAMVIETVSWMCINVQRKFKLIKYICIEYYIRLNIYMNYIIYNVYMVFTKQL